METCCWSCFWCRPIADRHAARVPIYCRWKPDPEKPDEKFEIVTICDDDGDEILLYCSGWKELPAGMFPQWQPHVEGRTEEGDALRPVQPRRDH